MGLLETGHYHRDGQLLTPPVRDLVVLVLAPGKGHPLVEHYRDPARLRKAIPHANRLLGLPRPPFVGELSYPDMVSMLRRQASWLNRAERQVVEDLTAYLEYKLTTTPGKGADRRSAAAPGISAPRKRE